MVSITAHTPRGFHFPHVAAFAASVLSRLSAWIDHTRREHAALTESATRNAESARVRRFAQQVMADDPRFAADLFAAADHHDRE